MPPISKFAMPSARPGETRADADAFMKAALAHDARRIREMIAQGADPNVPDSRGGLPLHSALRVKNDAGLLPALEALLEGGANPNLIDNSGAVGRTAFTAALACGRVDKALVRLLDAGADPLLEEDVGLPTLHYLAMQGRYTVLEAARAKGVDIDHRDARGRTCLMTAAREGFARTVDALLEWGADPAARDAQGFSVLQHAHSAAGDDAADVVRLVIKALGDRSIAAELQQIRTEVDALGNAVKNILENAESEPDK